MIDGAANGDDEDDETSGDDDVDGGERIDGDDTADKIRSASAKAAERATVAIAWMRSATAQLGPLGPSKRTQKGKKASPTYVERCMYRTTTEASVLDKALPEQSKKYDAA